MVSEFVFHPEIQRILEDAIVLIRSGEIDEGIAKLVGLIDFSKDGYKAKIEIEPNKWVDAGLIDIESVDGKKFKAKRFIGFDWFWASLGIIIKKVTSNDGRIHYWEIMYKIMGDWMKDSFERGFINKETYNKFLRAVNS